MKAVKTIITSIIVVALVAGGVLGVIHFYNQSQAAKHSMDMEDVGTVETKEVWNVANESNWLRYIGSDGELIRNQYFKYADVMNASEGNLFFCEPDPEFANYGTLCTLTSITQTDKETFNKEINAADSTLSNFAGDCMKYFFNIDHETVEKIGRNPDGIMTGLTGTSCVTDFGEGSSKLLGVNGYEYFAEHKLDLSCDKVTVTNMCAKNLKYTEELGAEFTSVGYFVVGTAEVKTLNAEGDMKDIGIFGNKGETVKLEFIAEVEYDDEYEVGIHSFTLRQINE